MKHTLNNKNNLLTLYNFALLFYFKPNSNYVPVHNTPGVLVWTENILKRKRSVDGKHLMRFQRETSVFKFFRRDHNVIRTKDNGILFGTLYCRCPSG